MSIIFGSKEIGLVYKGDTQITRIYKGSELVYSAEQLVTYFIDIVNGNRITDTREVEYGESCTEAIGDPTKSGYQFHGWRINDSASSVVYGKDGLSDKIMDTEPVELYAVFKKTIDIVFDSHTDTPSPTPSTYYYNNGNEPDVIVQCPQGTSYSGWTFLGWSKSGVTTANNDVYKKAGEYVSGKIATTYYGLYSRQVTLRFLGNGNTGGSTDNLTRTVYWSGSGNYSAVQLPSCGYTKRSHTFKAWAQGSASGKQIAAGGTTTVEANTDFYAIWNKNATTTLYSASGSEYIRNTYKVYSSFNTSNTTKLYITAAGYYNSTCKMNVYLLSKSDEALSSSNKIYTAEVPGYSNSGFTTYEIDISTKTGTKYVAVEHPTTQAVGYSLEVTSIQYV